MRLFKRLVSAVLVTTMVASIFTGIAPPGSVLDTSTTAEAASALSKIQTAELWSAADVQKDILNSATIKARTSSMFWTPLKAFIAEKKVKYANSTFTDSEGKTVKGAYFLTWTHVDDAASNDKRWKTMKYKVTPTEVSGWNTKTRDGFEISVYQCTEWRRDGKVQTRYFISANELKTKINANTKYGFKTAGEKQTIYFSGIMQVYYASSGKNGSELLRSASALGKYFGKTASAYAAHYNVQYTWKFKSPVYKTLQVHYIVKNSRSEDLPNGKTLDSYVELKKVKAGEQTIGGEIEYNKGKSSKTVYQDIIEKNGKTYAISGFYFLTYSNKKSGNITSTVQRFTAGGIAKAYEDPNEEATITRSSRKPAGSADEKVNAKKTYSLFERAVKKSKFTMLSEDTHLYFEYVEVKDPGQTINIKYQYQVYEDGKLTWKDLETKNDEIKDYKKDTYSNTFEDTLADSNMPYYGLYSITAVNDDTGEKIENLVKGSQRKVSDGTTIFYYGLKNQKENWEKYKDLVKNVKYEIPEKESITITVRYAARLPYVKLTYEVTKNEDDGTTTTKLVETERHDEEGYCPGQSIDATFNETLKSGEKYAYSYGSEGSMEGYADMTSDGWKEDTLPSIMRDASESISNTFEVPAEPLYIVSVYGDATLPKDSTIVYEYQYYEDGQYVWKQIATETIPNGTDVYENTFADTLANYNKKYYGLYSITAVNDDTGEQITNEVKGSQSEVSDGKTYFYYGLKGQKDKWKKYKSLVEKVKYTVPTSGSMTITVRYAARLPYVKLVYTTENEKTTLVETERHDTEGYCPGQTVTVQFDNKIGKLKFSYAYGSQGDMDGYADMTKDSWSKNALPALYTDKTTDTKHDFTVPDEPLQVVAVYGNGNTKVKPPTNEGEETEHSTSIYEEFHHSEGCEHISDSEDSTLGTGQINQDFNCVIQADTSKSDAFDVTQGIPSSEYEETLASVESYQTDGRYTEHNVKVRYQVTVSGTLTCWKHKQWVPDDDKGNGHYAPKLEPYSYTYDVERKGTYYSCDYFYVWQPKDLTVWNGSFPKPNYVTILPKNNTGENVMVKVTQSNGWYDAKRETPAKGTYSACADDKPDPGWINLAEVSVGQLKVRNDEVLFTQQDNKTVTLMDGGIYEKYAPAPTTPEAPAMTETGVYKKSGIQIPKTRLNGEYTSKAAVHYVKNNTSYSSEKRVCSAKVCAGTGTKYTPQSSTPTCCCKDSSKEDLIYGIPVNNVIVHTPVTNDFTVVQDSTYVQLVSPSDYKPIVLDTKFTINIPTVGYHQDYPYYGYKDYSKYAERVEVKFPIDVYSADGTVFYPKNKWFEVNFGDTEFLAASWNDEGEVTLQSRTIAINCFGDEEDEHESKLLEQQETANFDLNNYVATNYDIAEVSGRLYGLNIFDVSDYPLWQSVFRVSNTYAKTGFTYKSGLANQNGTINTLVSSKTTFPMVNGDHPYYTTKDSVYHIVMITM